VANGDLSKKSPVDVRGEILETEQTPSTPWSISSTRSPASGRAWRARWAPEGKLGGQALVRGAYAGTLEGLYTD